MRDHYLKQLQDIQDDLLRMGSRVEHAVADSLKAMERWDTSMAQRVIADDRDVDAGQLRIEEAILQIIATQAPVARDLRMLVATSGIAAELERCGDYATGIAKRVDRCLRAPAQVDAPIELHRMGTLAQTMLHTCLDAFVRLDAALARSLAAQDEQVDALEEQVVEMLLSVARVDPIRLDCVIALLDVAHMLERMADRATNIGERVIFIVTSTNEELNQ